MFEKEHTESKGYHDEAGLPILDKPESRGEQAQKLIQQEDREFKKNQIKTNNRLVKLNSILAIGTILGVLISSWIAVISQRSAKAAQDAVDLARKTQDQSTRAAAQSASDNQKVLSATLGALCSGAVNFTEDGPQFRIQNRSKGVCRDFTAQMTFYKQVLPSGTWQPYGHPFNWPKSTVSPQAPEDPIEIHPIDNSGFTKKDWDLIVRQKIALKSEGTYSYDNGFGDTNSGKICNGVFNEMLGVSEVHGTSWRCPDLENYIKRAIK